MTAKVRSSFPDNWLISFWTSLVSIRIYSMKTKQKKRRHFDIKIRTRSETGSFFAKTQWQLSKWQQLHRTQTNLVDFLFLFRDVSDNFQDTPSVCWPVHIFAHSLIFNNLENMRETLISQYTRHLKIKKIPSSPWPNRSGSFALLHTRWTLYNVISFSQVSFSKLIYSNRIVKARPHNY